MEEIKLDPKVIAAGVVCAVLLLVGGYFIYQKTQSGNNLPNNQQASADETKKLVGEVGKLMQLPSGEVPTVATVTDITKLSSQPFFKNAKNGDKVLIYQNSRKAIIYDPNAKKIIDITQINLGTSSAQLASPQPSASPKVSPVPARTQVPQPTP